MKATNILAVKDAPVPFITFEAPPEVASQFQSLGMVVKTGEFWVLCPSYGSDFDTTVKYMQEFEME